MRGLFRILMLAAMVAVLCSPVMADEYLEQLEQGQEVKDFRVANVYENGAGQAIGARFVSKDYGFIIDLMRIQSVPQAFYWIKTPITSSKGEPHACEHLLLGKGNRGRYVAALEDMSLGSSTAYTQQYRTCYHFNTIAGEETFYDLFEAKLDALLNPDFTDEEIRREVCHIGVTENPETGELQIEEKGTVYTEMVSAFEKPWYHTYGQLNRMVYGKDHPLSLVSGGDPDVMRSMVPEDMWSFHEGTHKLSNMGAIVSIPGSIPIERFLEQMNQTLERVQDFKSEGDLVGISAYDFPPVSPAAKGATKLVGYPSDKTEDPGYLLYAWPVQPELEYREEFMMETFLDAFANGQTSDLYNLFINSEKRAIDLGANAVFGAADTDIGFSTWFGITGVNNSFVTEKMLDSVETMITTAIEEIRNYEDGSPELQEFNDRVKSRLVASRKQIEDNLNSPPMFGFRRGPAGAWLSLLSSLEQAPGFRKSLSMTERFDYADSLLASGNNIWRERIDQWRLLTVEPYAVGAKPDPGILAKNAEAKEARLAGYVEDFKQEYGVTDAQ
ncbi:hypothetical protein GF377_02945, partial [candidate division GN15 bacterium]|nr:hypothetical protein [candidate division GN15 bacterium]